MPIPIDAVALVTIHIIRLHAVSFITSPFKHEAQAEPRAFLTYAFGCMQPVALRRTQN
jgi:hypothetical protein